MSHAFFVLAGINLFICPPVAVLMLLLALFFYALGM